MSFNLNGNLVDLATTATPGAVRLAVDTADVNAVPTMAQLLANAGGNDIGGQAWNATTEYKVGAVVTYNGRVYTAKNPSTGVVPETVNDAWRIGNGQPYAPVFYEHGQTCIGNLNEDTTIIPPNLDILIRMKDGSGALPSDSSVWMRYRGVSGSGWSQIAPSGLTIQWGWVDLTTGGMRYVTYPIPFKAISSVVMSPMGSTTSQLLNTRVGLYWTSSLDQSKQFIAHTVSGSIGGTYWIAIGYL